MRLASSLDKNIAHIENTLPIGRSFDFMTRNLYLGQTRAYFIGINGFCKTEILQQILSDLQYPLFTKDDKIECLETFVNAKIGYAQLTFSNSWETVINNILSGPSALIIDGFDRAVLIDVRTYPARGIAEPDLERVTRGARDGFVETMLSNTNLIRRRIRSTKLLFSLHSVGTESKTDISVAYLEDKVNHQLLNYLSKTIDSLQVSSLTMGAKSLEELLVPKKWWHPLPSIQVTERPDVACSYLLEGNILILVDNSPVVLILPCTIFQFTQSPEDFYNSTSVGTYFRLVRFFCIPVSMLLMPLFLLIVTRFPDFTYRIGLLSSGPKTDTQLFFYVLTVEFLLDLFKYSSALSSGKFSGSLSVVGGLIISDIAVSLNWASVEALFYGAITLLASLSISSREFSDALRIYRILLIFATGFFGLPGFLIGLGLISLSMLTTPTFGGFSYFWPLLPFNSKALGRILLRTHTAKAQPVKPWDRGKPHAKKESKK